MDTNVLIYAIKGLLLAIGMFDMGVALVVATRYAIRWREVKTNSLLPLHVWVVALSYIILLALSITGRINELGDPLWRWSAYGIAVVLGAVAMIVIAKKRHQEEDKR